MNLHIAIVIVLLGYISVTNSQRDKSGIVRQFNQLSGVQDCCAIQRQTGATVNGIYDIYPYEHEPYAAVQVRYTKLQDSEYEALSKVYCDFKTDGGGWTVFQRRDDFDGPTQKFFLDWKTYEIGFGSLQHSHWLGLSNIAALTTGYDQTLRVDLLDWEGEFRFANYGLFHVGDKSTTYKLTTTNYSGTAGDSMGGNGMMFSTYDMDHDNHNHRASCAEIYKAGWWYNSCHSANLNGLYAVNGTIANTNGIGVVWYEFRGLFNGMKRAEMKVRNNNFPNGCRPPTQPVSSIQAA